MKEKFLILKMLKKIFILKIFSDNPVIRKRPAEQKQ